MSDPQPERPANMDDKRARLAELLSARATAPSPAGSAPKRTVPQGPAPLSFPQQRFWLFDQLEPGSSAYIIGFGLRLTGTLNASALQQAVGALVSRHDVLRATFAATENGPVQVIGDARFVAGLVVEEVTAPSAAASRDAFLRRLVEEESRRPFDLARGPVFRARLFRLDPTDHLLTVALHHIVSDAWSVRVIVRELAATYEAFSRGAEPTLDPLPIQYPEFARWQREALKGERVDSQIAYWRHQLDGAPAATELPTDRPRPARQTFRGGLESLALSSEASEAIKALGRREGATLSMTMLAAFQLLLARLSGDSDIVVGSPTAGRTREDVEGLVGCFLNTIVFRTTLDGDPTFSELVQRVRETSLAAYAHQDVPFERLLEALQPARTPDRTPIFQVMFNMLGPERSRFGVGGLEVEFIQPDEDAAKFDLTLYVVEGEHALTLRAVYNADLFDRGRVAEMLRQLEQLLSQATAKPESRVSELSLVTRSAQDVLPALAASLERPRLPTVPELIVRRAEQSPEDIALDQDGVGMTYATLVARAQVIAATLRAAGVNPRDVIAVTGTPSIGFIAAMVGALLGRGVLLTLDRRLPAERQRLMLEQARAAHLLYIGERREQDAWMWREIPSVTEVAAESGVVAAAVAPPSSSPAFPQESDPAYIFFTSGTTGVPKAVLGVHRGLSHFVGWQAKEFGIGPGDRSSQLTGLSFDVVLREIFTPLTSGATLCLRPAAMAEELGADRVLPWMQRAGITVLHTVPTLAQAWLADVPSGVRLDALKRVFFAGEPLSGTLVRRWRETFLSTGQVINLYGPTETTLAKCYYRVPDDCGSQIQPVGRPMPQTQALVLRDGTHLCGVGEIGEIAIRTPFRTLGYANAPEETRRRFIANPFGDGNDDLVYLTGDRGRYRPDGVLEILGRVDDQVKIRGARIELGEVTTALCRHRLVRQGVVIARDAGNGEKRLVGYAVAASKDEAIAAEIHRSLQATLPEQMVPSAIVLVEALPVTANGKLDRSKLPEPVMRGSTSRAAVPPRTPIESALELIWRDVLRAETIDVHQNFFEAGGHSLLATQLVSRIRTAFRVEMPLREVYDHATIAALAQYVEGALRGSAPRAAAPIPRAERSGDLPVSSGQQRLWFIDRLQPDRSTYNVSLGLRLQGRLDVAALEGAFNEVIERHEALRATFDGSAGRLVQHVSDASPYSLAVIDVSGAAEDRREEEALRVARAEAEKPFDLARGPLYRAALVRIAPENHVLVAVLHHIISDVWSMGVLFREVAIAYGARVSERPAELPELPIQYADYAAWEERWLQSDEYASQLAYWIRVLQGPLPILELPSDRRRPDVQTFRGARREFTLSRSLSDAISELARREGVTPFTVLLAAYHALLHRYTGQQDIIVGFPVAGRNRAEFEPLIGFFVNTLPLRTQVASELSFAALVQRVHEASLGAFAHQEVPFDALVSALQPDRDMSRNPLFQVAFALHNTPIAPVGLPALTPSLVPVLMDRARFDLLIAMWLSDGAFEGALEYSTDVFDEASAARTVRHYTALLESAVERADRSVASLSIVGHDERRSLVADLNPARIDYPRSTIQEVFERQVERTPDAVAISFGTEEITYRALNRRANQLAHRLRRLGVGSDSRVAVCLDRSPALIVALLGILKAGGAYVPLDAGYPPERLAFMLDDIDPPVLVTERAQVQRLPAVKAHVICLDEAQSDIAQEPGTNPGVDCGPEHLAYVCYTSGSTGVPKGVEVPHRGVLRLLFGVDYVQLGPAERILVLAPVSFDASTFEIWGALLHGGCCVVFPDPVPTPDALGRVLRDRGVTTLWLTSSLFNGIVDHMPGALAPVRQLLTGGEALSVAHVRRAYGRLPHTQLVNGYGPTESTTFTACHRIPRDLVADAVSVPIGRPIGNTQVYVLDAQWRLAPIGVVGELFIGGDGVARGYMNRPDLTAERFVPDAFGPVPGARLYRTGDLVRWRTDGTLEYLGRLDAQVKIRGFRIEPGEIESVLQAHPAVAASAVVVREDTPGDKRLVAYVVPAAGSIASGELRTYLQSKLPDYMVPGAIVSIAAMPLSPNGKLDRRALPAPERERASGERALPPVGELERTLVEIWRDTLGVSDVGVDDNFFDLGGHSLLLVEVHRRLREAIGRDLPVVELFRFPTVRSLCEHLGGRPEEAAAPALVACAPDRRDESVAIVGVAGRFPRAGTVREFWANLCAGLEAITFFTDDELAKEGLDPSVFKKPGYVKARAVIDDVEMFDAAFFGYSPREAAIIDPQQRLFLECAWEALEDAGYDPERFAGAIGVYAGVGLNTYAPRLFATPGLSDLYAVQLAVSSDKDFLPTRVSYKLNLRGPSVNVQTACSTSLVAVHLACRSLLDGDCDMALAGGVRVTVPQTSGYHYQTGGIMSPDGHCRAFDAAAAGTVSGNGAGVVVLKRLADAMADGDSIYAVVKGSAINNDGSGKVGYTAPSVAGQAEVIARAHARAGVDPASISYVEAHGTGTSLGDPIEIAALTQAFGARTAGSASCAIGTLKTNVGHLDAAAGVAGLIKAALALKHGQLPPSLHFERANPQISFENSPFFVNTRLTDWPARTEPRRAGVSSFGLGGTNAHVVVEEAPPRMASGPARETQLLVLSARTPAALDAAAKNLAGYLAATPDANLADVAFTLQVGRREFDYRRFAVGRDAAEASRGLAAAPAPGSAGMVNRSHRPVAFMFTGQGAQRVNMTRGLYETESVFRERLDECAERLRPHLGFDLRDVLFPASGDEDTANARLRQTDVTQPALFAVEYALAELWKSWGVRPQAMIGHSVGEYVAACLAGVMSLGDALALVTTRGRLMQALPAGAMLSVALSEEELQGRLEGTRLSIAAINAPSSCVASGDCAEIDALRERLTGAGVECRLLETSHAFHSSMMDPALEEFRAALRRIDLKEPATRFISNLTGTWITSEQATSPDYWVAHLRGTVRFHAGLEVLTRESCPVLLEVGPGQTLASLARAAAKAAGTESISSLRRASAGESDPRLLLEAAGRLWLSGVDIDWIGFHAGVRRHRVPGLPTYPFERQRYWVDPPARTSAEHPPAGRLSLDHWFSTPAWTSAMPAPAATSAALADGTWVVFAGPGALGRGVAADLEARGGRVVVVSAGARFAALPNASFEIRPGHAGDYRDLVRHLAGADSRPRRFVHAWTAERAGTKAGDLKEQGFYSLLFLVQALGSELSGEPAEILVVTSGAQQVTGAESLEPEAAMAVAHCRVIPLEYPNVRCTAIDVDTNSAVSAGRDAELIVREACAPGDAVVALRGGRRWVQTFRPVTLDVPADAPHRLRQRGVYVVTGGTGGVGLALARYLARTVNARLVLIARTGLPPRERWSEWVGEYGADDAVSRVIAEVRDLEALGAEVLPVAADVADEAQMQQALEAAIARFGVLHGVLHAAGAEKLPRAIQELERGQCELQFRSRLEALPVLERVTRERPLDFVALSSSLSSVLGAAGFAPYTAAHVFMDAFAARRNSAGGTPWIAIDWDNWITWKSAPAQRDAADLRMTTEEGGEAFGRILACETATHVVVSTAPLDARREQIARGSARPARETVAAASLHARPALSSSYTAPRTDAERVLAGIWQDLLGVGEIGINDNFFELGGDSVTGIQVVARASAAGLRITTRQALEHQTIAELAAVASVATASVDHAPDGQGDVPLTPIQQWFFEQSPPEPNHFNQAVLLEVDRHLETSVLEEVADALARAHDVLRYRYVRGNDGWKQIAESVGAIAVRRVDLSSVPADRWSHAIEEAADHAQRGIDITNGPLMSVTFMDGGRTRAARLLLVAHHLIVDAVSWRVLLEDLYRGCEQRWSGTPIDLPRPGVSFQTWARRLAAYGQSVELAQEADFWLDQAAAAGTAVPVDFAGGSNTFAAAVRLDRALAADETTTLIHETCAHYRAQMPELLLTAVQQSLAEWMGGTAALVDVEGHGREDVVDAADIARTVGWFTTISPVVLGGAVPASPVEALKSVKERVRAIPHGGIGYGALRYLAADARNSERLRAMPHPEVSFLYLGRLDMAASTGWMRAASENAGVTRGAANVRRHVIDISVAISSGGLKVTWTYSEALHRRSTIDALADRFMRVLRDLIEAARSGHHEGYTPADFPAARLEQQDLDRLLATIKTGGTNQR